MPHVAIHKLRRGKAPSVDLFTREVKLDDWILFLLWPFTSNQDG